MKDKKKYVNQNVLHTIKIIEALEGVNFEPVTIPVIIERVDILPDIGKKLEYDKVRRVLITLELLGWAVENDRKEWTLGAKCARLAGKIRF